MTTCNDTLKILNVYIYAFYILQLRSLEFYEKEGSRRKIINNGC